MTGSPTSRSRERLLRAVVVSCLRRAAADPDLDLVCRRPDGRAEGGPRRILVVGVDAPTQTAKRRLRSWRQRRSGAVAPRADALVLVLVEPVRRHVEVVFIPRDIGVHLEVGYQRLGWALEYGGAAALATASGELTGIRVDHVVIADFAGFEAFIDAVGGVEVLVPEPARDRRTGVALDPGVQRIDGRTALAWVRSRHLDRGDHDSLVLGDSVRRQRLEAVARGVRSRCAGRRGHLLLARATVAARSHLVVNRALCDEAIELAALLRTSTVDFVDLATEPVVSQEQLLSPFPPRHRTGASYARLTDGATSYLRELASRVGGG